MTVAILLANGTEEIEAITPVDLLSRAGINVTMLGVGSRDIAGGHDIRITCDGTVDEFSADQVDELDAILVPGGVQGALRIAANDAANAIIRKVHDAGKLVASICASPAKVLAPLGLLDGKTWTCFPGHEEGITAGHFREDRVVTDGSLITSRGAGTAAEWSVAVISALVGPDKAREVHDRTLQP